VRPGRAAAEEDAFLLQFIKDFKLKATSRVCGDIENALSDLAHKYEPRIMTQVVDLKRRIPNLAKMHHERQNHA
jgi:hypothetical protein